MDAKAQASFDALDETLVETREEREAAYRKIGALKDVLSQLINDKAQVIHLQPDDVVVFSGVGDIDPDMEQIKEALGGRKVILFTEDVNLYLLRDLAPCPYCTRPESWDACPIHRDHP